MPRQRVIRRHRIRIRQGRDLNIRVHKRLHRVATVRRSPVRLDREPTYPSTASVEDACPVTFPGVGDVNVIVH